MSQCKHGVAMTSPDPTREPEPADDLVRRLRVRAPRSKDSTAILYEAAARIRADAETIRRLREERDELGYWKLRTHDYDAIISHSQDLKERAERAEAELETERKLFKESLRQWYAGMAMQALVSHPQASNTVGAEMLFSVQAFAMADAMLEEGAKP